MTVSNATHKILFFQWRNSKAANLSQHFNENYFFFTMVSLEGFISIYEISGNTKYLKYFCLFNYKFIEHTPSFQEKKRCMAKKSIMNWFGIFLINIRMIPNIFSSSVRLLQ